MKVHWSVTLFANMSLSFSAPTTYPGPGGYRGKTADGLRSGKGRYKFSNAFYEYEGEWVDGIMHGEGKLSMRDGSVYEGRFDRGAMNGWGTRSWADGSTYSGQFSQGEMDGDGLYTSSRGEKYEGQFERNLRQGRGQLTKATGDVYEGQFAVHHMAGQGTMSYVDGSQYVGSWERSKRAGVGTMSWPNGDSYEGEWTADQVHGGGLFVGERGEGYVRESQWHKGAPTVLASAMLLARHQYPAGDLELSHLVLQRHPAAPPAEDEDAPPPPEPPPELTLVCTLLMEGSPSVQVTLTLLPGAADLPVLEYAPIAPITLALPAGAARPLRVRFALSDAEGLAIELTLDDSSGTTEGLVNAAALNKDGGYGTVKTLLSMGYAAAEPMAPLDPTEVVPGTNTAESLAALFPEPLKAAARLPPLSILCLRSVEREPSDAEQAAHRAAAEEAAAAAAKGKKKGAEPEPEPEPLGNVCERFAVVDDSGRSVCVTLVLPDEVAAQRSSAAELVAAQAAQAWQAAAQQLDDAAKAASAAAENEGFAEYHVPEGPPEGQPIKLQGWGLTLPVGVFPSTMPFAEPPPPPPPPPNEWTLGVLLSASGRVLLCGLTVPVEVPSGPATLLLKEVTRPPALFELPPLGEVAVPVKLLAEGDDGAPPPPPPDPKGKKK